MKKAFVFGSLVAAIALVWVSIGFVLRVQEGATGQGQVIEEPTTEWYFSDRFNLSFSYPVWYKLSDRDISSGSRVRHSIVMTPDLVPEVQNGEGPTAITVDIFQNDLDEFTAERFATTTSDSNWKLGDGRLIPATVDGKEGVSYTWSGLYEGKSVVIARPDYVYMFSVTWLTPEDEILGLFDDLLRSVSFVSSDEGAWLPYSNASFGFEAEVPETFSVNESYFNYTLGPGKEIPGISFTIPAEMATGTNLSTDTRMSVEVLSRAACTPSDFIQTTSKGTPVTVGQNRYTYAQSTGAGAGNRYEESVYVTKQRELCYGVRFYIHSTVLANYPEGTRKEFDRAALVSTFKKIMETIRFI